jgi:hypothetical protein
VLRLIDEVDAAAFAGEAPDPGRADPLDSVCAVVVPTDGDAPEGSALTDAWVGTPSGVEAADAAFDVPPAAMVTPAAPATRTAATPADIAINFVRLMDADIIVKNLNNDSSNG